MGFFNSLKGQVGRDSGRAISNLIFGSRHASRYENVGEVKLARIEKDRDKIKLSKVKAKLNHERDLVDTKINYETFLIENQNLSQERDYTRSKINELLRINIPQKKENIVDNLFNLSVMLAANSNFWSFAEDEKQKFSNSLSDAVFMQYKQHLFALQLKYPKTSEIKHFEKQFQKYKTMAFFQKYKFILIGVLFSIFMGIGVYFEEDKPKETPVGNFFETLTEKIK